MLKRLLVILGLSPSLALAQGLTTLAPGATGGGKVLWSAPFSTAGCYASGQTAGASSAISITRTTKGTYVAVDGTTVVECQNNEFRVAPDGLLVEPARSSYALQSATHPKAAEATGAVPVGACVAWHDGTGTMTLATGAATVTGLSCTAVAAGTLCPFTVTVTGTMALTTTAGTTHAQIECPGAFRTSRIVTAGTSVLRAADAISATVPAVPSKFCMAATAQTVAGGTWARPVLTVWASAGDRTTNSYELYVDASSKPGWEVVDSVPTWRYTNAASVSAISGASHRLTGCYSGGATSLALDGTMLPATWTGTLSTFVAPTTLNLGSAISGSTYHMGGYLKNLKICAAKSAKECK